jgi:hypothetical protein
MTAVPADSSPTRVGERLRALFDEAWTRARRRRRWSIAVVATIVLASVVLVATRNPDHATLAGRPPVAPHAAVLVLPRAPGMGVACPGAPNSIACDRIGLAVWLRAAPAHLVASIGRRSVVLRDRHIALCAPRRPCGVYYTGYLQPAGLLNGALAVRPDRGRYYWAGGHPVTGKLHLVATYRDGRTAQTTRRVPLSPGWG